MEANYNSIAGISAAMLYPRTFIYDQLPSYRTPDLSTPIPPTEQILALQLGNVYLLLAFLGIFILNQSHADRSTARAYLSALWLGDLGHLAATAWVMGWQDFVNVRIWTSSIWGNVGGTIALWLVRTAWLLGYWDESETGQDKKRNIKVT